MGGHRISPAFRPERPATSGALLFEAAWRTGLKTREEVMEILEAFDLTGTLRGAAELAGCDHKTVAHWVRARDDAGGGLPVAVRPRPRVDAFAEKIEEWVDRSRGRIRADVAHQRLVAMGYLGSERTTRRAVAATKRRWRAEHGRRYRPWVTEPGLWMQWDYGDGPKVAGRSTVLFCAWLAWSRFRVIVPLWDRTMPSVVMALDRALRAFGGAPSYALTDNEKTVSIRPHLRDGRPQPADRVGRPPLWADDRDMCSGRSGVQGRQRGDGPDRQGRPGPDRAQPARRIRRLRATRERVRRVGRSGQHARAPSHAPRTGGDAGRGADAAAPAAADAAHRLFRPDAQGVLAVDDQCRRRALLGPDRARRRARLGPRDRRRARDRARRRARRTARSRPPPADDAGAAEHPRRALPAAAGGRAGAPPEGRHDRGAGVAGDRAGRRAMADRRRRGRHDETAAHARRGRCAREVARRRAGRRGARGRGGSRSLR